MFERILSLFQPETSVTELPEADAKHVLGALLVRAAKADKMYLFEEIEQIDDVLAHCYDLSPVGAAKLRAECELLDAAMPETADHAAILHAAITQKEREETVLALWEVVFADGRKAAPEEDLLRELEILLGVSSQKSRELHDLVVSALK